LAIIPLSGNLNNKTTYRLLVAVSIALLCSAHVSAQKKKELSNAEEVLLTRKYINADRERLLGNYQEAFQLYNECLDIDPTNDAVYFEIGNLYESQKSLEQAQKEFEKAAELDPENKWYKIALANALEAQEKFKEAAKVYQALRKQFPHNPDYILRHANALLYAGDSKEAIKALNEFESLAGVSPEGSLRKYKIYVSEGKYDEAAREMEHLIAAFPDDPQLYGFLADLYKAQGKMNKALEVYQKAIKADPNNPYIQLSLAEFYDRNNQQDTAFAYLERAYSNPELDIDTKIGVLVKMYGEAEHNPVVRSQALELSKRIVETHPNDAKSFSMYGDFLFLDKQWAAARTQYRKAMEIDPSKFAIWSQLLLLDSELNDPQAMLDDSKKAMELFPTQPSVYLFNGIANNQLKNYAAAAESLETGSQLVVGNPFLSSQMLASLGDAYHELGRNNASDSSYEAALSYDPENIYVLNNYSYFLSLRGEHLEKAAEMSAKTIERAPDNASYLDTYGWVLYKQGRYADAEKYLKRALDSGGGSSGEVLEHYGDTLFKLDRKEEAVEYWKKAKETGEASDLIDNKLASRSLND